LRWAIAHARWRLKDVGKVLHWLDGVSVPGIYKVLKRLGFSRKMALHFIQSPDPEYRFKWQRILAAYQEAVMNPDEVVLLFQDEFTYFRQAQIKPTWQQQGREQRRHHHKMGANTKARITATLDAVTGKVVFLQRQKIGKKELASFYAQVRSAYPDATRIYVVQDNWPVHKLPGVVQAAHDQRLSLLFLPTYASWLNPIEKLWRWLRQDVIHSHQQSCHFKTLRKQVVSFFKQFAAGSYKLLHYVGLFTKEELDSVSVLNC
jgi:transposase